MPRRLLVLNAVLAILSVVFAVGIVRTLLVKHPVPGPAPAAQRAAAASQPTATTEAGNPGLDAFAVIAAQNLFNPGRSETAVAAAVSVAKPILHGVVIHGAQSRAYLEDPTAKRVAGYSVGDTMGGGKIQKIADDRVVIARPEGLIEVLLQDPSKPRPAPTATAVPAGAAAPGQLAPSQVAPGQVVSPVPGPPATPPPSTVPQFRGRPAPQG
jgi:type II secretory pathway component PulC